MTNGRCWGFQIGGITDTCPDEELALHSDVEDRVQEFLLRHGGSAPVDRQSGAFDHGLRGWTEIRARDGYVLRIEWSKSSLRSTLVATERHN
jgi:hypothetical protein